MISKTTSAGNATSPAGPRPDRRELGRVVRFVVIGCTCTAIDYCTNRLLSEPIGPHAAKGLSYVSGMLIGFVGNKFWTFGSRKQASSEVVGYVALYVCTLGVNVGVNAAVLFIWPSAKTLAFLAATGVTTVLNYIGLRLVAFRKGVAERDAVEDHPEIMA